MNVCVVSRSSWLRKRKRACSSSANFKTKFVFLVQSAASFSALAPSLFPLTMRTLRPLLLIGLLACILSTRAASLSLQNSSPCTAWLGVSASPSMCFLDSKLVTLSPGDQWSGSGFDDSCVTRGASGYLLCNAKTIQCQGANSVKTSYTLTANAADAAAVTSCSID